jgi:putative Holliday junction resolvase
MIPLVRPNPEGIPGMSMPDVKLGRILAIDYGRKRMGIAISDELGLTAQPLVTVLRINRRNDLCRLRDICRKHDVTRILVGHPLHMSGEAGAMAEEAARFGARLRKELAIEVEMVDERLTSWEAERTVAEIQSSSRRKQASLDDVAAAVLLRDYLEHKREQIRSAVSEKE